MATMKLSGRALIIGALAGVLAGVLIAASWGCATSGEHYESSPASWIFAREAK